MSALLRRWGINLYQRITGRRIMQAFEELLQTQWYSRDELYALQRQKLQSLVEYANQYVPYYQRLFKDIGFEPNDLKSDPDCFRQIPTVDKAYIRNHREDFITTDPDRRKTMRIHSTSGSTGHPFIFWEDNHYRDYVRAGILRHLTWAGWEFGAPYAYLWGLPLNPSFKQKVWSTLMNVALNRFVSDAYVLSRESMRHFAKQIRRRKPKWLIGYPSSIVHFARFVQEEGLGDIQFLAVFSTAEVLYPYQRKVIEQVFGCRVFNRYASLEAGGLACECQSHTAMHISVENCVVEILDGDKPAKRGEPGQMVITNLNNSSFPFIRYRLGDVACLSQLDSCSCGRQHPMLEKVEGRQVDMFKTKDGRTVWGDFQSNVFEVEGIKQFQIVQKSLDLMLVRLVIEESFQRSHLDVIERTVKKAMGPGTEVKFEFLDSIPVGRTGKFRYAISEVSNP